MCMHWRYEHTDLVFLGTPQCWYSPVVELLTWRIPDNFPEASCIKLHIKYVSVRIKQDTNTYKYVYQKYIHVNSHVGM